MLAIDRRNEILQIVEVQQSIKVPELSKRFNVTEETIRRDLEKLEKDGHVKRTYGGAVLNNSTNADLSVNIREVTNVEGKEKISLKVADFIEDGDTLMLDSSTTALYVAKAIRNKQNITVITNSLKIHNELANSKNCEVISTGGVLKSSSLSFVGHWAEAALQNYYVNKAVMSCKGIDIEKGITEPNEMEAQIKNKMIHSAGKVLLAVDSTKFQKKSFVRFTSFDEVDILITEKNLPDQWEEVLQSNHVEIVYTD